MNYTRRKVLRGGALLAGLTALSPATLSPVQAGDDHVKFLNWADYIGKNNLSSFYEKTGIKCFESYFVSVEELHSRLKNKNHGFDVACGTHSAVAHLIEMGLLHPIDIDKIPNFANISHEWRGLNFDATNSYHVPYLWGTTGIGYNSTLTGDTDMADMKWLLDSDKFSGEIAWLDSSDAMAVSAMVYLNDGKMPATYDPILIKEAFILLEKQKKHVRRFSPDSGQELLMTGEVTLALEYNGDICQISYEDDNMKYALPKNGGTRWVDVMVMPKYSHQTLSEKHIDNVHQFINHMLDAHEGAHLASTTGYLTPNAGAQVLMSDEPTLCSGEHFFPPKSVIDALPYEIYYGAEYYKDINARWEKLKS